MFSLQPNNIQYSTNTKGYIIFKKWFSAYYLCIQNGEDLQLFKFKIHNNKTISK